MAKEAINPENVYRSRGYSQAMKAGKTVYLAGIAPYDLDGNVVGKDDFPAQAIQAFENLKRVLEAAGATMDDLVTLNFYLKDYDNMDNIGEAFAKYVGGFPYPASLGFQVSRLPNPDVLLELDGIAVID